MNQDKDLAFWATCKIEDLRSLCDINKCDIGHVYNITEPINFPRLIKTLLLEQTDSVACISHSISYANMVKSLIKTCSQEELTRLEKKHIYYYDVPDMDLRMIGGALSVILENNVKWLIIKSSARFLENNRQNLIRLATNFHLIIVTIGVE